MKFLNFWNNLNTRYILVPISNTPSPPAIVPQINPISLYVEQRADILNFINNRLITTLPLLKQKACFWELVCIEKWSQNFDSGTRSAVFGTPKIAKNTQNGRFGGY